MRTAIIPLAVFFLFVGFIVAINYDPQPVQNTIQTVQNSPTVKVTMDSLPCIIFIIVFFAFGVFTMKSFSVPGAADFSLNIGRVKEVEPEVTSDGSFIGYRYLAVNEDGYMSVTFNGINRNGMKWGKTGYLQAHTTPNERNTAGIYAVKRWDDPELRNYKGEGRHLVKVKLWGDVVVGTKGYRAQKALVVEDYGEV